MNRRIFIGSAAISLISLAGCDSKGRPAATATITNSEEIATGMTRLAAAISELDNSVGDFEDSNWKDVVPEVRNSSEMVRAAFGYLSKALGTKS
jgi:outer membrane murein-binding lipoprotein Lpp